MKEYEKGDLANHSKGWNKTSCFGKIERLRQKITFMRLTKYICAFKQLLRNQISFEMSTKLFTVSRVFEPKKLPIMDVL